MKFFVDTADAAEIRGLAEAGMIDGVTTNPTLIARSGRPMLEAIAEICALVDGPVSAEVAATEHAAMLEEGRRLAAIAPNVAVKVPLTVDGLRTCRALADEGRTVNVTLCFSPQQALLAARAGAGFVSPFIGRLDDLGQDGIGLVRDICAIYRAQKTIRTEVLAASVRGPLHVVEAARCGAHAATLPPAVLRQLYRHPLTDAGLDAFLADWRKTGQSILDRPKAAEPRR